MNKPSEALKFAQHDQKENDRSIDLSLAAEESMEISGLELEEEMVDLFYTIDAMLPDSEKKVIQFIGSKEGEGTSTIIKAFAKVAAGKFGKSVRLLDMDLRKTGQLLFYDFKSGNSAKEAFREGDSTDNGLDQVSEPRLFVKSFSSPCSSTNEASEFVGKSDYWEKMRQKFDFILVDSLPATTSASGLAISRKMDGVIIVLEAEKTRWEVVESVKNKIIKHGGKILGVVFNKQKHYIPKFIYKSI